MSTKQMVMSKELIFISDDHKYISNETSTKIDWLSATTAIGLFKKPFDARPIAEKCAKNKKSKWYGLSVEEILTYWDKENHTGRNLGSWYHDQRERDVLNFDTITREGKELRVIHPIIENGLKYSPEQKLEEGIYPEHFVYLKSAGLCGQADRVEVVNGYVNIYDYKTNKEIKQESYSSWDGVHEMMLPPISHIMDCNYYHYALQLSLYMYMIIKHNPKLKPGLLQIDHVIFDCTYDQYGNRILNKNVDGNPIVKDIVPYNLPYLRNEVRLMISHIEKTRKNVNKTL